MKKKLKILLLSIVSAIIIAAVAVSVLYNNGTIQRISISTKTDIKQIDLSVKPENIPESLNYLYDFTEVAESDSYLAHPDSVLLADNSILQLFPNGHGKGEVLNKISNDGGLTYSCALQSTPESWKTSEETPTVYKLNLTDGSQKFVMISANPDWNGDGNTIGGFNCSVSNDGNTWSEFQLFYPKSDENGVVPIVAMSALTQLKENGKFVDKWIGLFHDNQFYNYKTILTFDNDGNPQWSIPEKYFQNYRNYEIGTKMCEVEMIRSDCGTGDELCIITRSNTKTYNSLVSFSQDEGQTWSKPKELPSSLNGERFKAEYAPDGRLVIVFRSIERDIPGVLKAKKINGKKNFYSNGPVMWVGTYDDLKTRSAGQYRIKLAHTYFDSQQEPSVFANPDTGYCGNSVLPDGTFIISTYGKFSPQKTYTDSDGNTKMKTYIISKQISLADIDALSLLV